MYRPTPATGPRRLPRPAVAGPRNAGAVQANGYDRRMATAVPSPSPNPNAVRFQLDTTLDSALSFGSAADAEGHPFAKAVFAVPGVASIFGVNDFVTVTRAPGAEWDPIVEAVQQAAASHL